MIKNNIYIIGNKSLKSDNIPYKILDRLKERLPKTQFIPFDPTEDIDNLEGEKFIAIDTVYGIDKVTIFKSLDDFESPKRFTVHDFDLYTNLALLKKINKIKDYAIIGVPQKIDSSIVDDVIYSILSSI